MSFCESGAHDFERCKAYVVVSDIAEYDYGKVENRRYTTGQFCKKCGYFTGCSGQEDENKEVN